MASLGEEVKMGNEKEEAAENQNANHKLREQCYF